jgi:hypothetical protein
MSSVQALDLFVPIPNKSLADSVAVSFVVLLLLLINPRFVVSISMYSDVFLRFEVYFSLLK